jgi:hypothetical protein
VTTLVKNKIKESRGEKRKSGMRKNNLSRREAGN